MKKIILITIGLIISSCSVEKALQKKKDKATSFMLQNKPVLAELCSDVFPVEVIEVVKGDTVRVVDVELVPGVEISCPEPTPSNPKPSVKCPDCHRETITLTITDTIKIRDTAKEYALRSLLDESSDKIRSMIDSNHDLKEKLRRSRISLIVIVLLFVLGCLLVYRFRS